MKNILLISALFILATTIRPTLAAAEVGYQFPASLKDLDSQILTDQVRGGLTEAKITPDVQKGAVFSGRLCLIDNAGFARVLLSNFDGSAIAVGASTGVLFDQIGDGRVYRFFLIDATNPAITYEEQFQSSTTSGVVQIDLKALKAYRRGRIVPNAPNIDLNNISSFGFEVADKIEGEFELSVRTLTFR